MRVPADEAFHILLVLLLLDFGGVVRVRGLYLLESLDWVHDYVVDGVEFTFFDGQKLAHDSRQAIKVVAVQALLLLKQGVLVQQKVSLDELCIHSDVNEISILVPAVENTGQENTLDLFVHHLHQVVCVANLLDLRSFQRLL